MKGAAVFVFEKRPRVPLGRLDPLGWQLSFPENADYNGKWSPEKQKGERKLCSGKIKADGRSVIRTVKKTFRNHQEIISGVYKCGREGKNVF